MFIYPIAPGSSFSLVFVIPASIFLFLFVLGHFLILYGIRHNSTSIIVVGIICTFLLWGIYLWLVKSDAIPLKTSKKHQKKSIKIVKNTSAQNN